MSMSANPNFGVVAAASGGPSIDWNNNAFNSDEQNGLNTTGILRIMTTGEVQYQGDFFGQDETGLTWWAPIGTTNGTGWSCQIVYISAINQSVGSPFLSTWYALTTQRNYTFNKNPDGSGGGTTVGNYRFDLSNDGGSTTYDSVSFSVTLHEETI